MFTGIIEETGSVAAMQRKGSSIRITVKAGKILCDVKNGDSIAVNGICLTVTEFTDSSFMADMMPETVSRTAFSRLKTGAPVNLERAMPAGGRFGGHIVSGHIDGTGTIRRIEKDENAQWFTIEAAPEIMRYIVEKGSVAVDGISLTVADLTRSQFRVSVIPHTLGHTALAAKQVHDMVNLENDCVGKYIEKFVLEGKEQSSRITTDFLSRYGYQEGKR